MTGYKLNLSAFKKNRKKVTPLFEYIERFYANNGAPSGYSKEIPYPENLERFTRLFLPIFAYNPDSQEFKDLMLATSEWCETWYESAPVLGMANIVNNRFGLARDKIEKLINGDAETFISTRFIEAQHLAQSGPTIVYHPDLLALLQMTDAQKASNVPTTMLKVPYTSIYLDWRDARHPITSADGQSYQGCYVQSHVVPYDKAKEMALLDEDASLRLATEKGYIVEGKDILFFDMLFIGQPDDPDMISNTLFSIACSIDPDIKISDTVFSQTEVDQHDFLGVAYDDMKDPISLVINSLMYMLTKQSKRQEFKEASGMMMQIKKLKNPAKVRKAEQRLNRSVYDYVRIGKSFSIEGLTGYNDGHKGAKKSHVRFGHFNTFYVGHKVERDHKGEIRRDDDGVTIPIPKEERDIEVKWIMPTTINADKGEVVPAKNRKMS